MRGIRRRAAAGHVEVQDSLSSSRSNGQSLAPLVLGRTQFLIGHGCSSRSGNSPRSPLTKARDQLHLLHPLTSQERQAVSAQIQQAVTDAAVELLKEEQEAEASLHTGHIKALSLLLLAVVALGACMVYLRSMLVPFVVALFFTALLEPLLFFLAQWPKVIMQRLAQWRASRRQDPQQPLTASGPISSMNGEVQAYDSEWADLGECNSSGRQMLQILAAKFWLLFTVIACILTLIGVFASVIYGSVTAVSEFPWEKYADSKNLKLLLKLFPLFGTEPRDINVEKVVAWLLQGPLFNALDFTITIITQSFLTLLFLAFLLASDASAHESEKEGHGDSQTILQKIRESVRRYIRIKTLMAVIVAGLTGGLYSLMRVDLWFLFAVATFLLYYIPHVGNTIAVLLPLPLVFFDPQQTFAHFLILLTVPFFIHHMATNLVDPKLFASSLDLHPIIILLSLAFWTTVWGPIGSILSVPLTAVLRLLLHEVDHPYTRPAVKLLEGNVHDLTDMVSSGRPGPGRAGFERNAGRQASERLLPTRFGAPTWGASGGPNARSGEDDSCDNDQAHVQLAKVTISAQAGITTFSL